MAILTATRSPSSVLSIMEDEGNSSLSSLNVPMNKPTVDDPTAKLGWSLSQMQLLFDDSEEGEMSFSDQDDLDWTLWLEEDEIKTTDAANKPKSCRFAENIATVHEIEKLDDRSLWWTSDDDRLIRSDANQAVDFCKTQNPKFAESILCLSRSNSHQTRNATIDKLIKFVADDCIGRGLERHIAPRSNDAIKSVLREQEACRHNGLNYSDSCERLRLRSLQHTTTVLALRLAESDRLCVDGRRRQVSKTERSRRLQRIDNFIRF